MKKKKLSTEERQFLSKITGYSALAGATLLLAPTAAKGDIVYVNPTDITVDINSNHYALDVNDDGVTDFQFRMLTAPDSSYLIMQGGSADGGVIYSGSFVKALDSNYTINGSCDWDGLDKYMGYAVTISGSLFSTYGPWAPTINEKYIGINFYKLDETYYYGWIRASAEFTNGKYIFTIHDWAYEGEERTSLKTGEGDTPTPIELVEFLLSEENGSVRLNWQTASETENSGFIIQRKSADGAWEKIADHISDPTLAGHGTTSETNSYSWMDENVEPGATYQYRLGDIDHANTIVWHDVLEITVSEEAEQMPEEFGLQSAFPNPFNPTLTIRYGLTEDAQTSVKILDLQGKTISTLSNKHQKAGSYELQWQADDNASGMYLVEVVSNGKKDLKKVLLAK